MELAVCASLFAVDRFMSSYVYCGGSVISSLMILLASDCILLDHVAYA